MDGGVALFAPFARSETTATRHTELYQTHTEELIHVQDEYAYNE